MRWSSFFKVPARLLATAAKDSASAGTTSAARAAERRMTLQDKVLNLTQSAIEEGRAHFRIGSRKLYFPKARVILLRPNAKHTPYQAKFIVPKSFNKLDLRDYLYHLYGLRALNITTQLLHGRFRKPHPLKPRYRDPQIKKMTIEMQEPFIWPEETKDTAQDSLREETEKYMQNGSSRLGSDKFKPGEAFGGALGPYKEAAQAFVPRMMRRKFENKRAKVLEKARRMKQFGLIDRCAAEEVTTKL
ncbi:AaceriAFR405Wp [[Ashbya] aceris (nom. inval.)]|nr:AaceriAFR405Wp [[Ashbya] aceris (nom. inval.)]